MQNVYRCSSMKLLHLGESSKRRKRKRAGYCPKSRLCCDREFSVAIGFAWHCVVTTACARVIELASLVLLARFVTQPSERLGGLGRNGRFLCHDIVL